MSLGPYYSTDEYGWLKDGYGDVLNKAPPDRVAHLCIREFDLHWQRESSPARWCDEISSQEM
jgi:hypothetical protein